MMISTELLSTLISFVITLLILSYLLGDNPLFRAAAHIFVGVSAGYVAAVAWNQVIDPLLIRPIWSGEVFSNFFQAVLIFFPLVASALLLTKASPHLSRFGRLPVAYLVGVGAAVAIGGAVLGTLIPQVNATLDGFDIRLAVARGSNFAVMIFTGVLILLGVIGTLAYFHFGARRQEDGTLKRNFLVNILSWIGRIYIAITFGVLFAGVYMAALSALIERMDAVYTYILLMIQSL